MFDDNENDDKIRRDEIDDDIDDIIRIGQQMIVDDEDELQIFVFDEILFTIGLSLLEVEVDEMQREMNLVTLMVDESQDDLLVLEIMVENKPLLEVMRLSDNELLIMEVFEIITDGLEVEVDGMDDEVRQVLQILGVITLLLDDEADLFGKDKIQFLQDIWFLKIIFWMKLKILLEINQYQVRLEPEPQTEANEIDT